MRIRFTIDVTLKEVPEDLDERLLSVAKTLKNFLGLLFDDANVQWSKSPVEGRMFNL